MSVLVCNNENGKLVKFKACLLIIYDYCCLHTFCLVIK